MRVVRTRSRRRLLSFRGNGISESVFGVEPLEELACLVFGRHSKLDMDIHAPGAAESGVQGIFVVRSRKQDAALCCFDPVKGVQETRQGDGSIMGARGVSGVGRRER